MREKQISKMSTELEENKTSGSNPLIKHASENFTFENVKLKEIESY